LVQASIVFFLGGCFAMGLAVADAILQRLPRLTARLERFIDGGDAPSFNDASEMFVYDPRTERWRRADA
jgi:hypothetical protein